MNAEDIQSCTAKRLSLYSSQIHSQNTLWKGKGKGIAVQAYYRRLRHPVFETIGTQRWSGCEPTQENIPGTHLCYRLSWPQGNSTNGRIIPTKNYNDTIWDRTRGLPACSAVSQPAALLRASPPPHPPVERANHKLHKFNLQTKVFKFKYCYNFLKIFTVSNPTLHFLNSI